jgi:hypothetical protein
MRNNETHFEQVPIEIVEILLRQEAAPETMQEKSLVPVLVTERQATRESPKPRKTVPSKGRA